MYTRLESAQQKWGGSLTAIDNWLDERQRLIVRYCELASLPPFDKKVETLCLIWLISSTFANC